MTQKSDSLVLGKLILLKALHINFPHRQDVVQNQAREAIKTILKIKMETVYTWRQHLVNPITFDGASLRFVSLPMCLVRKYVIKRHYFTVKRCKPS